MGRVARFSKYCMGHTYTKKLFIVYVKCKFNWLSYIFLGNFTHSPEDIGIHSEEFLFITPTPNHNSFSNSLVLHMETQATLIALNKVISSSTPISLLRTLIVRLCQRNRK